MDRGRHRRAVSAPQAALAARRMAMAVGLTTLGAAVA